MGYIIDFVALALLYVFVFLRKWKGKGTLFVNTLMYISFFCALFYINANNNLYSVNSKS